MRIIKSYKEFGKINEMTEFNLQRYSQDSVRASIHVDDPNLSTNAFDKHQDMIRQAMSRVNDIMRNMHGTGAYSALRGRLALEDQDILDMKILRITKVNNICYDVYLSFKIGEQEYWGVIENVLVAEPEFKSEVFKDLNLYQTKEWVIRTKGLIVKTIKEWLKPEAGNYRLVNDEVICYSTETGKQLRMKKGIEIELVRAHSDRNIVRYEGDTYNLIGDNYVYFNWWFEKI